MKNSPLKIGDMTIQPGERLTLALPTPELYTCAPIYIPMHVIHGKSAGPVLLVCGSLHGDEINGVAITQKLLTLRLLKKIKGTVIVIPTLNIYGMMTLSRSLPDRRDLDGSFPGSKTGSFASRLAYFLNEEIFSLITHCIDLHTGEPHIEKFPQIKTDLEQEAAKNLAQAFEAPIIRHTSSNDGLLWLLHDENRKIPTITFETGEALRLNANGIKTGVKGILKVMRSINLLPVPFRSKKSPSSVLIESSTWMRAPSSGMCEIYCKVGTYVSKGMTIAKISDPFGTEKKQEIYSPFDGIVIARHNLPILNEGEPILELAKMKESAVENMQKWVEDERETYD